MGRGAAETEAELIIDAKASLGEGPCWDAENGLLYWVDILGHRVHIYDPATNRDRSIDVGQMVSAVVKRASGGFVIAAKNGLYFLDPQTEELILITDPESGIPGNRFNDGKCDPAGRFWAGTMSMSGGKPAGSLYRLDSDGTLIKMMEGVACSNGLAWSPGRGTMYYIDSPTRQVTAMDYDVSTGRIGNRRAVITLPPGEGVPDGMTTDSEGMLWVAQWGGWKVSRWNPYTGERLETVSVPAAQVTSCAFGGPELNELYITSARTGLSESDLAQQPSAGGVFRWKSKVKGMPAFAYGGQTV
ncbi:SMP-30/gluconolactonase/LRE family protein [Paenibacillus allorhizosphaerae]|uniref:6-deoxy-6-sulfogluconolactonase n=1 Tax=Paenibacillus allorhizosphaerae TaxID=2849866 RepID=A0ABN7TVV5_9BACL|nr:SMP-30/gluconolactonase/LRE family protein [Paenibacillus allorhizosphaerae]CAG7654411.1 6-deoxy-6-sulfogluconolactonase [Paenibacillus allorhizosphaerae]